MISFLFDLGPYSPLEANHSSCHYATKTRRVQVDGDSINSVGLEEEQYCHYRRLLVSFSVHLSQRRQIVSLRHTNIDAIHSRFYLLLLQQSD